MPRILSAGGQNSEFRDNRAKKRGCEPLVRRRFHPKIIWILSSRLIFRLLHRKQLGGLRRSQTALPGQSIALDAKGASTSFTRLLPRPEDIAERSLGYLLARLSQILGSVALLSYRLFAHCRGRGRFSFGATTRETETDQGRAQ
jgi:hypothetical protein